MDISLIFNNTKLAFKGLVVNRKCHSKKGVTLNYAHIPFKLFFMGNICNLKNIILYYIKILYYIILS